MTEQEKQAPSNAASAAHDAPSAAPRDGRTGGGAPRRGRSSGGRPDRTGGGRSGPGGRSGGQRRRDGGERVRSEFDQKVVSLRRVARVVAGGRRFSFSAAIVAGDRKGRVGVGLGKGADTALAMDKAMRDAKKNMIRISMTDSKSIPHDTEAKYGASVIALRPSPARGIVAGSSIRTVLELAGVMDVTAKIHSRSKNKLNNARATVKALEALKA